QGQRKYIVNIRSDVGVKQNGDGHPAGFSVLSKKTKPGQSHDTPQYQGGKETTIAANGRERKERNEISWHRRLPHLQIGIIAGDPQRQKHHHNRLLKLFVAPSAKRAGKNLSATFPLACIFFVFDHAQRTGTSSP